MPAKDLGAKHTCFRCGTKFYDLKRPAPTCPKCGADQRESPALKSPPPVERKRPRPAAEPEEPEVALEEELEEAAEEEAEDAPDDE